MRTIYFAVIVLLAVGAAFGQNAAGQKVFDKDGLKFSYPADWTVTDRSNPDAQSLMLSKPGTTVLISIISPRETIGSQLHYRNMQKLIREKYVDSIKNGIGARQGVPDTEGACINLNGRDISGNRFTGTYNQKPATGDFHPFVLGNRFVTLIYLRTDSDTTAGDRAWKEMVDSLNLAGSNRDPAKFNFDFSEYEAGILNGKAISLARPAFPGRSPGGLVIVNVTIDEKGKVVSTHSEGAPEIRLPAVQAANLSKFEPTLKCGKPVRVTGRIIYNFDGTNPYKPPSNR